MLFKEIMDVYSENHTTPEKTVLQIVKIAGTNNYC
jgi:hypothetical protein